VAIGGHGIPRWGIPGARWGIHWVVAGVPGPDDAGVDRSDRPERSGGPVSQHQPPAAQSNGWIVQTYISFAVSMSALALGIAYMPGDPWKRAFLGVAALYAVTSSISLSKTVRDQHEAARVVARVDEARFERLLTEHDPYKAPL
jgi:hypothetical protein